MGLMELIYYDEVPMVPHGSYGTHKVKTIYKGKKVQQMNTRCQRILTFMSMRNKD